MDDPIQQLRIEHEDLEYQWGRFMRGQNGLDPNPEFGFLENHHILEFGLEEDFIQRHDLAVMVRHLFMRDLDLTRCDQGLSSYIRMFRPQLNDSASKTVDDPGMYWKTLMQIVCLVMALCMRENQDIGDYSPIEDLARRWEQKTRGKPNSHANLERISDSAMAWMFDIATRAALDTNRLYGLYQNTLKLVILQLEEAVQELSPPPNDDGLVDNLMEIRNNQLATLYQKFERLGQPAVEYIDPDWFEQTERGGVFAGEGGFTDDEGEGEGDVIDKEEEVVASESEWQGEWERFPVPQQDDHRREVLQQNEVLWMASLQQEDKLLAVSLQKEDRSRRVSLKQEDDSRMVSFQRKKDESLDARHEPTHSKEVEPQKTGLGPGAQDDGVVRGTVNDGLQENLIAVDDVVEKASGAGEKEKGVREKTKNVEKTVDKGKHRSANMAVEDDEEEEDEPLMRRQRPSKQAFDPYSKAPDKGDSDVGETRGLTISFTRPGSDNVAQASLVLAKSIQMRVAKIREQDLSRSDTTPAAAEAATNSKTDSRHESTSPQKTNQQEAELIKERTLPLEQLPPTPSLTSAADPTPAPEPTPESATTAPKSVPEPELQSEPDPFIRLKKTKRIFKAPSESEFEDDDDVPFRELKKMSSTQKSASPPLVSSNQQSTASAPIQDAVRIMGGNSSSNSNGAPGTSTSNDWNHMNTGTQTTASVQQGQVPVTNVSHVLQTSQRISAPKEKRKYRPWSKEEVRRLMELAPRFFHDQSASDGDGRRRKVKWAKLKTYDEHHGNLLKYRTQVNLKDKYREQTDKGQHRQEVAQINQAKAEAVPQYKFPKPKRGF
ncbi:hypothetical protein BGW39_002493 [Mortierella sp. 14UC]|nr:hypothetical protein BGW39_002493 [Mortierella sp. 14UC]